MLTHEGEGNIRPSMMCKERVIKNQHLQSHT